LFINYHQIIVLLKQSSAAHRVRFPAGRCASIHSAQRMNGLRASCQDFTTKDQWPPYLLSGLSHVGCNVGGLLQAKNKAENNSQSQGSASCYLGQPAIRTN